MFRELQALVAKSPVIMLVSTEGDKMRVNVTQKEGKNGAPLSLTILATPEELDAELPAALASAAGELAAVKPIADQVADQVDAAKERKKSTKAAPKRVQAKPKPAPKAAKKKTPAPAPKKTAAPKVKKPAAAPKPARKSAPHSSKPTKEQCIADLIACRKKHGDDINRETFMDKGTTGRRFERLFGNWNKFVAAADRLAKRDTKTPELPGIPPAAEENDTAAPAAAAADFDPVDGIVDHESAVVIPPVVRPAGFKAGSSLLPVITTDGEIIGAHLRTAKVGDEITLSKIAYRVLDVAQAITVVPLEAEEPPAPIRRKIVDDEGENLGTHEGEALAGAEIDTPHGVVRIVRVTDKVVFVEPITATQGA